MHLHVLYAISYTTSILNTNGMLLFYPLSVIYLISYLGTKYVNKIDKKAVFDIVFCFFIGSCVTRTINTNYLSNKGVIIASSKPLWFNSDSQTLVHASHTSLWPIKIHLCKEFAFYWRISYLYYLGMLKVSNIGFYLC